MLSYLHSFHAGNLADVHKHSVLAWVLSYLTQKDKPVSYLETHSGRALYALDSLDAQKTAEARTGILREDVAAWFHADHPYRAGLTAARAHAGAMAYPGSPWLAHALLRPTDRIHLAELHPGEVARLRHVMGRSAIITCEDGYHMANRVCPPTPRRGLLLVDPSYELKGDYDAIPEFMRQIRRKWNVGILMLWYPILREARHVQMTTALVQSDPESSCHEVRFGPARAGHGMIGSGLWISRQPFGLADELARLTDCFARLQSSRMPSASDR